MARDSDGLAVRKWAKSETALALAPTDITPADGLPASYGVDSFISLEVFNYLWRQVTALGEDVAKHGVLEWDAAQEYLHPSFVIGSDTNLYQSVIANTAQDPTTDDGTYWTLASSLDIASASETVPGIIRTATVAEALAGTSVSTAVTPEALAAVTRQLVANAVNDVTTEPGEYVFSVSGARTWPWDTTKGRAVLSYINYTDGIRQENLILQAQRYLEASRGMTNDGSTFWIVDALGRHIYAWTITGVRDSDKDIDVGSLYYGITYLNNRLIGVRGGGASDSGIYTIELSGSMQQKVVTFTDTNRRRGITTDGDTLWVVNDTTETLEAYSASDWSRQIGEDITLFSGGSGWGDVATNGSTYWVSEDIGTTSIARAWDVKLKTRDTEKDYSISGDRSYGLTVYDSVLHMATIVGQPGHSTTRNVLERVRLTPYRELVIGDTDYAEKGPGQYELTGISKGDTIRATLKEDEDFAIVYPVY